MADGAERQELANARKENSMNEYQYLSPAEREFVQAVLRDAKPGKHTLAALFGEFWAYIVDKTSFGMRLKRTVKAGLLHGIEVAGRTIQNHQLYVIGNRKLR